MCSSSISEGQAHFQRIESCLNYQGYIYPIDSSLTASQYTKICQDLLKLGKTKEERMGVVYIYETWGFCIIPGHGFPELRLNFYHETPINDIKDVMASISAAFETPGV